MSRNLSTYAKQLLGPGHVIEDANPTPIAFRKPASTPEVVPVKTEDPLPPIPEFPEP